MMRYLVNHARLSGHLTAPPSKSQTLRAILFASLAKGRSSIHHYLNSPDTNAMLQACRELGAHIQKNTNTLDIVGVAGKPLLPQHTINAANSGIVLRFITAIAALAHGPTTLTGDHSIRYYRPINPLIKGLSDLGAVGVYTPTNPQAVVTIQGPIAPGHATLEGADSQPVSALLIASALLDGITTLEVSHPGEKPWVELTLSWFDRLGIPYTHNNYAYYTVEGGKVIEAFEYTVPGDFSSIAYPLAAGLITPAHITIDNIRMDDAQGDKALLPVLRKMGANIQVQGNSITVQSGKKLIGCTIDVNDFIDALPILAVIGCYATGTTILKNAAIARKKESDRLATITLELNKMGGQVIEKEEALIIQGAALQGASVDTHNDHRVAMSLTVAALGCTTPSTINGVACINKTYPHFASAMQSLGGAITVC